MSSLVSVIIPVYNREAFLEECIASVFAQSYQNFEIILVDDGSTDNTLAICHSLEQKDSRIRIFESGHVGVSAARNIALDNMRGDYALFVDSDDVIHPFLIETLLNGALEGNAGIAGSAVVNISEARWESVIAAKLNEHKMPGDVKKLTFNETMDVVFLTKTPIGCIGGVMISSELIGNTRFRTDLFIGEDFWFIYENLIKETNVIFLEQKWYFCRHHQNNISWNWKYEGFYTRFYRRQLAWESEEKFGRIENANRQKHQAFSIYLTYLSRNKLSSEDSKKIRSIMKKFKNVIMPALSKKRRMAYPVFVYFPIAYIIYLKLNAMFKRIKK